MRVGFNVCVCGVFCRSVPAHSAKGKRMEEGNAAKERVLITGGGGYFGFRLVHDMVITYRNPWKRLLLGRQQNPSVKGHLWA